MHITGAITARGGSKGLPGKNVRIMCGKPLIGWTIDAANSSQLDRVCVSTDDEEIAARANDFGAHILSMRAGHLSDDTASIQDVLLEHVVVELKLAEHEVLCLLQPTSPLRHARHIDEACALYARFGGQHPIISVTPHTKPIAWIYGMDADDSLYRPFDDATMQRRQDDSSVYMTPNGALYIASVAQWRAGLWHSQVKGYTMLASESVDIDTPDDWLIAQALLNQKE